MKRRVYLQDKGLITLGTDQLLGSGGEAEVWRYQRYAVKIFFQATAMIPPGKFQELAALQIPEVLSPQKRVEDPNTGKAVGYTMALADNTRPLVKLFSMAHQKQECSMKGLLNLLDHMRRVVSAIHRADCLVVDLNEMNVLVTDQLRPYFIDTNSYQTPNFPATALMPSVADPRVVANQFTEGSDWFSFAVLACQLFTGVHPFKGRHPDYKPAQWPQRMLDGVSIFHARTVLPPGARPLERIPQPWRAWLRAVFEENHRGAPPTKASPTGTITTPHQTAALPTGLDSGLCKLELKQRYPNNLVDVFALFGECYATDTLGNVWRDGLLLATSLPGRITVAESEDGTPVFFSLKDKKLSIGSGEQPLAADYPCTHLFLKHGRVFSYDGAVVVRHRLSRMGDHLVHTTVAAAHMTGDVLFFNGAAVKKMLGRTWLWMPTSSDAAIFREIPEMAGYRFLAGKADSRMCLLMAERGGTYHRLLLRFDETYQTYTFQQCEAPYQLPNLAVTTSGIGIVLDQEKLTLCSMDGQTRQLPNPGLPDGANLFGYGREIRIAMDNRILRLSTQ